MEHTETGREVTERTDGTWWGKISCCCGWARGVGDRPNEDATDLALQAAWIVHTGRG